jgi:hypothetical protein
MKKSYVLSLMLVFLTSLSFADTINLPKTGQTICYDRAGIEIPCAGTGQDGEIQAGVAWPSPRFTVSGDVVTDNLTGLMWASKGNLTSDKTWQEALDYCNNLNLGGYSDWRLPNVNELESLVNVATELHTAIWLETQGFTTVQTDYYWSSTTSTYAHYTDNAWKVDMYFGLVSYCCYKSNYHCVLPVRGGQCGSFDNSVTCLPKTGQTKCYNASGAEITCSGTGQDGEIQAGVAWPSPRFIDYGNGTVTDNLTGLMWTKNANLPNGDVTWQQALDYVKGMNNGTYENFGYTDWCLPNQKELHSLTDYSLDDSALPSGHPFTNVASWYWSSTTDTDATDEAWYVNMYRGSVGYSDKDTTYGAGWGWPVRGGQIGERSYNISGTVTLNGAGLDDVTITLSGDSSDSTTTDFSGNYRFTEVSNGSYIITPSRSGYSFTPPRRSVTVKGDNVTGQSFTASTVNQGYSISRKVTLKNGGTPLAGVTMKLSGAATATTSTDNNGNYSFTGLANGSYTITPSKSGYKFSPKSKTVKVNNKSVTNVNFKGKVS